MKARSIHKSVTAFFICAAMMVTGTALQETGNGNVYAADGSTETYVNGEAVVLYDSDEEISKKDAKELLQASDINAKVKQVYNIENKDGEVAEAIAVVGNSSMSTEKLVKQLNQCDDVILAEPNYKVKALTVSDAAYGEFQWSLDNKGQNNGSPGEDVNIECAPSGSDDHVVAIIDTGVDYTHPDIKEKMWVNNQSGSALNGEYGMDFADGDDDPMDDNGHGTHCAGVIAGAGSGISGIDSNARIMALKFLDADGEGYTSGAIAAYEYISKAQDQGIDVVAVNNSWGGEDDSKILKKVIDKVGQKGAVSVCAAGNDAVNCNDEGAALSYPACYDSPYIVNVAATDENGNLASYSDHGSDYVDLAAPGSDIVSSVCYDSYFPSLYGGSDSSKQKRLSQKFNNFDEDETDLNRDWTPVMAEDKASCSGTVSAGITSGSGYGKAGSNAFELDVTGAKNGDFVVMRIPYTVPEETVECQYFTMMLKTKGPELKESSSLNNDAIFVAVDVPEGTQIDSSNFAYYGDFDGMYIEGDPGYWNRVQIPCNSRGEEAGAKREIVFVCALKAAGDYTVLLDDIGLSSGSVKSSEFGKYDNFSGTSMATPAVTAALALNSSKISEELTGSDRAKDAVGKTIRMVKEKESLSEAVSTGGVLDFSQSQASTKSLRVRGVTVDQESGQITISGCGFSQDNRKVELQKVDGQADEYQSAEIVSVEDDAIVIKDAGWINHYVNVRVRAGNKTVTKSNIYLENGKKELTINEVDEIDSMDNMTTDGANVYYTDNDSIYSLDVDQFIANGQSTESEDDFDDDSSKDSIDDTDEAITNISSLDQEKLFGKRKSENLVYETKFGKGMAYADGILYAIACLEEKDDDSGAVLSSEYKLISTNAKEDSSIRDLGTLPVEVTDRMDWAMASYNGNIYIIGGYDKTTRSISRTVNVYDPKTKVWSAAPELPAGRGGGKALQSGNQLIYLLGYSDDEGCPKALIFNGSEWDVSAASLEPYADNFDTVSRGGKQYTVYTGAISPCKDGILLINIQSPEYGSIFKYHVASDQYQDTGYRMPDTDEETEDDFWEEDEEQSTITLGVVANDKVCVFNGTSLYTGEVKDGTVKVTVKISGKGAVSGSRTYLPGNLVSLTGNGKAGYYCSSIKSGKTSGASNGKLSFRILSDSSVNAQFKKYSISTSKKSVRVKAGKTYRIKTKFTPAAAASQKTLKYKVSRSKYASVSKKGLVTTKKAGKRHTVKVKVFSDTSTYAIIKIRIR